MNRWGGMALLICFKDLWYAHERVSREILTHNYQSIGEKTTTSSLVFVAVYPMTLVLESEIQVKEEGTARRMEGRE